jgi:AcrR family transcriptional regulator
VAEIEKVTQLTDRPAGRPKVPRAVRERQMLAVAERAFAEQGFHAASVDAIAAGAGISKPMIYAYFGSKEGLFRGCMEQARSRLFHAINAGADAGAAPDEQLWLGILAFFTFVEEQRDSAIILFGEAAHGPFAADSARIRHDIARLVSQLLFEAAAAEGASGLESTEPLAHALIGAGESLAGWWREHPDHPKEAVARLLMNFAWMGFGDLVRGQRWAPRPASGDVLGAVRRPV